MTQPKPDIDALFKAAVYTMILAIITSLFVGFVVGALVL